MCIRDRQWAALDDFIENDSYLSSRRGDFAEPNQSRTPFEHILDLKLTQEFSIGGNKAEITFDVFNFTNLISSSLGRRFFVANGNSTFQLIQANRDDLGDDDFTNDELTFNFSDPGDPFAIVQSGIYSARWNAQLGFRYSFDQCSNGSPSRSTTKSVKVDTDGDLSLIHI